MQRIWNFSTRRFPMVRDPERKGGYPFHMDPTQIGEGLAALLSAQAAEAETVGYPALECHAQRLVALCEELDSPVVWPVGPAAERIAGAATLLSSGDLRVRAWSGDVRGEQVLVFAAIELSPLSLLAAATQALNMGAASVAGCGIHVRGLTASGIGPLASYHEVRDRQLTTAAGSGRATRRARAHRSRSVGFEPQTGVAELRHG
jgi:hypothetical protein